MVEHRDFGVLLVIVFAVDINLHRFVHGQKYGWARAEESKNKEKRRKSRIEL
jgi:hypothetical protein